MPPSTWTHLTYQSHEQRTLRYALQKAHALKSDWREGVRHHVRKEREEEAAPRSLLAGAGRPPQTPRRRKPPTTAGEQINGMLHLQMPSFSGAAIRSRLSGFGLDDGTMTQELLTSYLAEACEWQPPATGELVVGPLAERGRQPSPPRPWPALKRREFSPPRPETRSKSPPTSPLPCSAQIDKFVGKSVEKPIDWGFLRHVPGGELWSITGIGTELKGATVKVSEARMAVIYNDAAAIMYQQPCPDGKGKLEVTALEIIRHASFPTCSRWRRVMKPADDTEEALAKKLARALSSKTEHFRVTAKDGLYLDDGSLVGFINVVPSQTPQQEVPRSAGPGGRRGSRGRHASRQLAYEGPAFYGRDDPQRDEVIATWFGLLPIARELPLAWETLRQDWSLQISFDRLHVTMCAVERFESLRKMGPNPQAGLDAICLRLSRQGAEEELGAPPRRSRENITADWVIAVLGEPIDDDHLEDGDSVRLLTHLMTAMSSEDRLTEVAWLFFCRVMRLYRRGDASNDQPATAIPRRSSWCDTPSALGGPRGRRSSLAGSKMDSEVGAEDDREALARYQEADAVLRSAALSPLSSRACCPLLTEVLMQHAAQHKYGSASGDEMISVLLWRLCGWDSPSGRRLIRRLCRIFDRYAQAGGGGMTKSGFVRMCIDGGLTSSRDKDLPKFQQLYVSVVGSEKENTHFLVFLTIVEKMMALLESKVATSGLQVWQQLEAAVSKISAGGGHSSKAASTAKSKAMPKRMTVRPEASNRQSQFGSGGGPGGQHEHGSPMARMELGSPTMPQHRAASADLSEDSAGSDQPKSEKSDDGVAIKGPGDCGTIGPEDGLQIDPMPPADGDGWAR
eukprot:TRINITY_DN38179_c0_g2_i1.p1 TRINITY_DN38179_c0_g2~~TRINITY_DN38179_c0_g2_i1.p1  ORF type:complete len:851 (-),score=155.92 TRINITY_DN38179_c0_g2_i1:225-2777(-)